MQNNSISTLYISHSTFATDLNTTEYVLTLQKKAKMCYYPIYVWHDTSFYAFPWYPFEAQKVSVFYSLSVSVYFKSLSEKAHLASYEKRVNI